MVFSHTRLSAKKGKSNLYTSFTTSTAYTGLSTFENVFCEKSIMEKEAIEVSKRLTIMAIFSLIQPYIIIALHYT